MAGIYSPHPISYAGITEDHLNEAYNQCRATVWKCAFGRWTLLGLLDRIDRTIEEARNTNQDLTAFDISNITTEWCDTVSRILEVIPRFSDNVGFSIERANSYHDTRKVFCFLSEPMSFTTAHAAAKSLGCWLGSSLLQYSDKQRADDLLIYDEMRQGIREALSGFPEYDLAKFTADLSMEWRNACDWLSKQPTATSTAGNTNTIDPIDRDDLLLLVGGQKSSLQKRISEWGGAKQFPDPCSYAMIRPYLLEQWPKKEFLFPESYQALLKTLALRRRDRRPDASV